MQLLPTKKHKANSADKLRHPRSVAYSQVLLNKQQILGGTPKLDCHPKNKLRQ